MIQGGTSDVTSMGVKGGIDESLLEEVRPGDGVKGMSVGQRLAGNEGM